jgi:tetratricopeptide (TPR) repeat protein
MNRSCTLPVAAILLAALGAASVSASNPRTWTEASREAAKLKRMVLVVYREGKTGQGEGDGSRSTSSSPSSYASRSSSGLPITRTLADKEVRLLVRQYCVLAHLRMGDDDSGWKSFEKHGSPVVFALPDGTFLRGLSTDATPEQFTAAIKEAVEKAREAAKTAADKPAAQPAADVAADAADNPAAALKEAEALTRSGNYPEAVRRVKAVMDAAEADSPDAKRAERAAKALTQEAEKIIKQAEALLTAKKPIPAFRQFDEVAHLFAGLPVAEQAAKRLDEVMAQKIMEDYAAEYAQERVAYELYEKAMGLYENQFWKDATTRFQEIVDKYPQSPVAARAAEHAEVCRKKNAGDAATVLD